MRTDKTLIIILLIISQYSFSQDIKKSYNGGIGIYIGKSYFINNTLSKDISQSNATFEKRTDKDINILINYRYVFNNLFFTETGLSLLLTANRNYVEFSEHSNSNFGNYLNVKFTIPVDFGYRYELSNKLLFDSSIGIGLSIIPYDGISEIGGGDHSYTGNPEYWPSITIIESNHKNPLYPDIHATIGIGIEMNKIIIQPKLIYSKSFKDIRRGTYQFHNLPNEPDFGGTFKQSGDYFGFQLGIQFKKKTK